MKIKVNLLSITKDSKVSNEKMFRVCDLKFNVDENSLINDFEDSETLKCLKYVLKENKNTIGYDELSELADSSCIMGNNFWNEEYLLNACRFEYRDYFDFTECKFVCA